MKRKLLNTLKETEIEEFESLTLDDYLRVVNKVLTKKKPMMIDFIDSSARFKVFIYWMIKLVYDTEQLPEDFYKTELVALFKKGSALDPNNYRFIHLNPLSDGIQIQAVLMGGGIQCLPLKTLENKATESCDGVKMGDFEGAQHN